MELYIEKDFLDNFYATFDEKNPSIGQGVIADILKNYEEVEWYYDQPIDTPEKLQALKEENPFFAWRGNLKPPIEVEDIEKHFFKKQNHFQTLILTNEEKVWFPKAEHMGALCFHFGDYEKRLKKIITECHFKFDLSKSFSGWKIFNSCKFLPLNFISINDNYILSDKDKQKMDDNIIQLLKVFLRNRNVTVNIKIQTKDFDIPKYASNEVISNNAHRRHNRLKSALTNYPHELYTINNEHSRDFDLHDRTLYSNFLMIDSGKGFNLLPHKSSNSQIIVESIFNRYTYNRIRNHQKNHDNFLEKLQKLETVKFKSIPEKISN